MLVGKYRVERVIGRGGMGVVVEARHIALEQRVALKFLLAEYALNPESSARFLREARAAVRIKSEHVARVSDVGTLETGAPYMVMEFLVGQDLARLLQESGPLSLEDAVDYVIQGCEAIAEAHGHGIVHRDLKPANLFLTTRADGSPLVKVLDFGISKLVHSGVEDLTRTAVAMGSALYMSPEQMHQTRSVDHRTDIYALGVSLFELCAGRQPFYAETLPQLCAEVLAGFPTPLRVLRPDLPDDFAAALERAYARDRDRRYPSIAEFVLAIAPYAPPRSRPLVDRIARMAGMSGMSGMSAPMAAEAAPLYRAPLPSPAYGLAAAPLPPPTPTPAPMPQPDAATTPIPLPGASASLPAYGAVTPMVQPARTAPPAQPGPTLERIVPGHYNGPTSRRAAATFATGSYPRADGVGQDGGRPSRLSSSAVIAAIFAAAVAIGLGAGVLALRSSKASSTPGASDATAPAQNTPAQPELPPARPEPPPVQPGPGSPSPSIEAAGPAPSASAAPEVRAAGEGASATTAATAPPAPRPGPTSPQAHRPLPSPRPQRGVDLNNPD